MKKISDQIPKRNKSFGEKLSRNNKSKNFGRNVFFKLKIFEGREVEGRSIKFSRV